jgi:hypothetical protein
MLSSLLEEEGKATVCTENSWVSQLHCSVFPYPKLCLLIAEVLSPWKPWGFRLKCLFPAETTPSAAWGGHPLLRSAWTLLPWAVGMSVVFKSLAFWEEAWNFQIEYNLKTPLDSNRWYFLCCNNKHPLLSTSVFGYCTSSGFWGGEGNWGGCHRRMGWGASCSHSLHLQSTSYKSLPASVFLAGRNCPCCPLQTCLYSVSAVPSLNLEACWGFLPCIYSCLISW